MDEVAGLRAEIALLKQKLVRRDARILALKTRLTEKRKYEAGLLQFTGASPSYIRKIENKDLEVLRDTE